jgi:hypothetical protein
MGPGPLAPGVVRAGPVTRRRARGVGCGPTVRRRPRPGRVRDRDGGSHAPRPRHGRPEAAAPAGDGHRRRWLLPTVQRAQRRVRPRRAPDASGAGRRRLGRQRPEGVDVGRPGRQQGDAGRTHERGRAQARRDLLLPDPHGPARHRGSSPARDDRPQVLQRGVHHRCPRARRRPRRRRGQGLDRGQHDARLRARPVRGLGRDHDRKAGPDRRRPRPARRRVRRCSRRRRTIRRLAAG